MSLCGYLGLAAQKRKVSLHSQVFIMCELVAKRKVQLHQTKEKNPICSKPIAFEQSFISQLLWECNHLNIISWLGFCTRYKFPPTVLAFSPIRQLSDAPNIIISVFHLWEYSPCWSLLQITGFTAGQDYYCFSSMVFSWNFPML